MSSTANRWHASPRTTVQPSTDDTTGEIRLPLSLYQVDEHQGDVPLVLSRVEAEQLHASLSCLLGLRAALSGEVVE